jgi:hypothetical protein
MRTANHLRGLAVCGCFAGALVLFVAAALGQLLDNTQATSSTKAGINKSLSQEIGVGTGDEMTPDSSQFIISRDPFRAIRRGRQLFQRKFSRAQGQGPAVGDGSGDVNAINEIGAGLADSCAACHGRPRGSAGFGGDVFTRPDSRDAPHLFGIGLREMLADEITADLRAIRAGAISKAQASHQAVSARLISKGIDYGSITAHPNGSVDTSRVEGVNADLRVRPFFAQGKTISIREFTVGALKVEMGLQAVDPALRRAHNGGKFTTPSGMVLDGSKDNIEDPPTDDPAADPDDDGVANEIPASLVDFLEFYLLNYFKPATYEQTLRTQVGRVIFKRIGCTSCHIPDLKINWDRRVADVETIFDSLRGIFNGLFATATPLHDTVDDGSGFPALKPPQFRSFIVKNIFTDFKRHDVGPNFYERNHDGTVQKEFLTRPLWGVGSTPPYGHDGRSINLTEVILRHGGEARDSASIFAKLPVLDQNLLLDFLNSLVIFPPDDTASNLDPGNPKASGFPQFGHGSIKLTVLFNDPADPE